MCEGKGVAGLGRCILMFLDTHRLMAINTKSHRMMLTLFSANAMPDALVPPTGLPARWAAALGRCSYADLWHAYYALSGWAPANLAGA
jgi:hypothetical protein